MEKLSSTILILLLCIAVAIAAALILEMPAQQPVSSVPAATTTISQFMGTPVPVVSSPGIPAGCQPLMITQTDGKVITLSCQPERIIAANANAAELLIGIGAGNRIVGVTESTMKVPYIMDKIPAAAGIGDWQVPNIERMLSLNPGVVIAYSSSKPRNIDMITTSNITIVTLDCFKLSTLASDARSLGKITGKMNEAEVYARLVEDTIAEVNGRIKKIPSEKYPDVYFEMYTEYSAAAPGSGADEIVTAAGGKNIAAGMSGSSVKVSPEWVVARQPEYILKVVSTSNNQTFPEILAALKNRPGWNTIPAVKNDRVYILTNDVVYGPRAYIGLVWLAQLLHPDEFRDLHPRTMLIDYNNRYVNGTNASTVIYP